MKKKCNKTRKTLKTTTATIHITAEHRNNETPNKNNHPPEIHQKKLVKNADTDTLQIKFI